MELQLRLQYEMETEVERIRHIPKHTKQYRTELDSGGLRSPSLLPDKIFATPTSANNLPLYTYNINMLFH